MDNASEVRVFYSIMLPLVGPGLAAVAIFTAIQAWNEFLFGLAMTTGGPAASLTVGIASLVSAFAVTWGQMAAAGSHLAWSVAPAT
jgi:ABC-type glycerol-3-phosphate transport system permease component